MASPGKFTEISVSVREYNLLLLNLAACWNFLNSDDRDSEELFVRMHDTTCRFLDGKLGGGDHLSRLESDILNALERCGTRDA